MYILDRQIGNLGLTVDELYFMWVKCSLNRTMGSLLPLNGKDTPLYRKVVKKFNERFVGKIDDTTVDKKTQNELLVANQRNEDYMKWVQKALFKVGYSDLEPTGIIDTKTVQAIKDFQSSHKGPELKGPPKKLKVDGWVGFKTEMALIVASNIKPPCKTVPRPKKCKQEDLELAKMLEKMPILHKDPKVRLMMKCLRDKLVIALKCKKSLDDLYLFTSFDHRFGKLSPIGPVKPFEKRHVITDLKNTIRVRCKKTTIAKCFKEVFDDIEHGIVYAFKEIHLLRGITKIKPSVLSTTDFCKHPCFFMRKAKNPKSIYSCFRDIIFAFFSPNCLSCR